MATEPAGYRVEWAGAGTPLVVAFGGAGAAHGEFEHADLFARIARHRGRPFSLVTLQDRAGAGYYRGVAGLGDTIDEVAAALRARIAELRADPIVTFGAGIGGHAALVLGVLLGAHRIVAVAPPSHLIADELERYNDRRWRHTLAALPDPALAERYDVPALIARTDYGGRAFVLLGTRRGNDHHDAVHLDAVHAHRLARAGRVTLVPYPESGPDVLDWLTRRGEVEDRLSRLLLGGEGEEPPAPPAAPATTTLDPKRLKQEIVAYHYNVKVTICAVGDGESVVAPRSLARYAAAGEVDATTTRKINDGWRRWIVENLLLEASPTSLIKALEGNGISDWEATLEISRVLQNPYFRGAERLRNRVRKRDWLIASYRKLRRLHPAAAAIERRRDLDPATFLRDFYSTGRPVILQGTIDDWPALSKSTPEALSQRCGEEAVEVGAAGEARPPSNGPAENRSGMAALREDIGTVPGLLVADDRGAGVLRIGPAGTAAPFHHDRANSLLAQVVGTSRVSLSLACDLPLFDPGRDLAAASALDRARVLECTLSPGEVLFLPVGAWYRVEALETSATVSFTNFVFDNAFPGDPEASGA